MGYAVKNPDKPEVVDVGEKILGHPQPFDPVRSGLEKIDSWHLSEEMASKARTVSGLAFERFSSGVGKSPDDGKIHFLDCGGTGSGKKEDVLLSAIFMAEKMGKPALIATRRDLVEGEEEKAAKLSKKYGFDFKDKVQFCAFDDLPAIVKKANHKGETFSMLGLDESQDIPRNPAWKQAVDEAPAPFVVHLSATPFNTPREAAYLFSRILGKKESDVEKALDVPIKQVPKKISQLTGEAFQQGSMVRFENPFYGKMGGDKGLKVYPLDEAQTAQQDAIARHYAKEVQNTKNLLQQRTLVESYQKEIRALSDDALVDHAVDWITSKLDKGKKVIFYGTDESVTSAVLKDENGKPAVLSSFLASVQKGLEKRLDERSQVARMSDSRSHDKNLSLAQEFAESSGWKKGCNVLLMPYSQAAGHSFLNQQSEDSPSLAIGSGIPTTADDLLQIPGRGSRRNSMGPTTFNVLSMDSLADYGRVKTIEPGVEFLQSVGSLWAQSFDGLSKTYEQNAQKARKEQSAGVDIRRTKSFLKQPAHGQRQAADALTR